MCETAAYVTSIDCAAHTCRLRFQDTIYISRSVVTDDNYKNKSGCNQAQKFERHILKI